ncbi:MAG TPA: LLM class flavin-dependent oxidoreductase [Anaerolineales bacterium]|nr:LLM class flavin-dependent oxidoreductase [Anaerolineales bacterium]
MTKQRVALYLQDAHSLQDGIKYAQYAESKGFEAVWQAESRLVRDAIVPMAAFAATTTKLKVGSGVINNWTRNIGLLAATLRICFEDFGNGHAGRSEGQSAGVHQTRVHLPDSVSDGRPVFDD